MNFCSKMNPEITWTKKKNCYMMLGSVNVLHQYNKKNLVLRVQYTIATLCGKERCSRSSSSSRPSILAQCLASTSLEQYLSSGTASGFWNSVWVLEQCLISGTLEQQWLSTGHKSVTVSICRNSTILKHYDEWIYVYVSIEFFNVHCKYPIFS